MVLVGNSHHSRTTSKGDLLLMFSVGGSTSRIMMVTRGAAAPSASGELSMTRCMARALAGVMPSLRIEYPAGKMVVLDVDPSHDVCAAVQSELHTSDGELEVWYGASGERMVRRYEQVPAGDADDVPVHLSLSRRGSLDYMHFAPVTFVYSLDDDEVEVDPDPPVAVADEPVADAVEPVASEPVVEPPTKKKRVVKKKTT